jgi:hypothetical protein
MGCACSAAQRRAVAEAAAERALADAVMDLDIAAMNITRAEERARAGGGDGE